MAPNGPCADDSGNGWAMCKRWQRGQSSAGKSNHGGCLAAARLHAECPPDASDDVESSDLKPWLQTAAEFNAVVDTAPGRSTEPNAVSLSEFDGVDDMSTRPDACRCQYMEEFCDVCQPNSAQRCPRTDCNGAARLAVSNMEHPYLVECEFCGMSGPRMDTPESALAQWNTLSMTTGATTSAHKMLS